MKKRLSLILCAFFLGLTLIVPIFSCVKNSKVSNQTFSLTMEDIYFKDDSIDLISVNPTSITDGSVENGCTPFNPDTKQKMDGACVTPIADDCGQFKSKSFRINGYNAEKSDAIYMWVYLIDALTFKLKISITDGLSSTLTWQFDSQAVYDMGVGWKFLQLNLSDFENKQEISNQTYNLMTISYLSEMEDFEGEEGYEKYDVKTNERFSFYHVFASKNANQEQNSGKIYGLSKSFYEFSDDFVSGETFYIGDSFKLVSPTKIFKYLYIGKYDLSTYSSSGKYFWTLSLKSPESVTTKLEFGDTIYFRETGYFYLGIQLYESSTLSNKLILNEDISLFCDELSLGSFPMGSSYKIKDNEKITISFKLSNGLVLNEDYNISLSNNKAEIDSYYIENGVLFVCVAGKEKGTTTLEISANATSSHNSKQQTFSATATIDISSTKKQFDVFLLIVWITFACFCIGIVIYLSISLVKARKNDVK